MSAKSIQIEDGASPGRNIVEALERLAESKDRRFMPAHDLQQRGRN